MQGKDRFRRRSIQIRDRVAEPLSSARDCSIVLLPDRCQPIELGIISTAEIITEIDAYLLCLRQARELLDGLDGVARRHNVARKQAPIKVTKAASVTSITAPTRKVRVHHKVARPKMDQGRKTADLVVASARMMTVQMTPVQPEVTVELPIAGEGVLLSSEPKRALDLGRRHINQQRQAKVSESAKPVNALSNSAPYRVIVVSAEEAQKSRESAAHPAVNQPRVLANGLTGRRAFEALFTDATDSSVASSV